MQGAWPGALIAWGYSPTQKELTAPQVSAGGQRTQAPGGGKGMQLRPSGPKRSEAWEHAVASGGVPHLNATTFFPHSCR